jgi:hypothetical protein
VRVLGPDLAARLDAFGPAHEKRVAHAAPVGLALPPAEGRVARVGPTPRVVIEVLRSADVVDGGQLLFQAVRHVVEELVLVDRAGWTSFGAGAVVRDHHDEGVLVLAQVLQGLDELADVVVHVGEEAGEHLHHPCVQLALVGGATGSLQRRSCIRRNVLLAGGDRETY